jgi:acetyl-CoA acyltransferase 1
MTIAGEMLPPHPRDAVIVQAIRTPLCRARKGGLAKIPPSALLSTVLRGVLLKEPQKVEAAAGGDGDKFIISPDSVQDICVGNVLSPPTAAVSFRMAALSSDIPHTTSLSTTNRQCSSGLQAIANIAHAIQCGSINIGIGAGVESMSLNPMHKLYEDFPPEVDWDVIQNCGNSKMAMDCLVPMGVTSENVSKQYHLDRRTLDEFAAKSHQKAAKAQSLGKFGTEIIPVGGINQDDGIRPATTAENLAKLKPVFDKENGSTTAGNSSQLTDGAAAVLLMSREEAMKRNIPILAVFRSYAVEGVPPKIMGVGPVFAIPSALKKVSLSTEDIDVYEINEAFASQAYYSIKALNLDPAKVNPNGGAIALGHPLGCSGARMVVTLLNEMRRERKRRGVVSMCIGTGMGAAAVLEVESMRSSL